MGTFCLFILFVLSVVFCFFSRLLLSLRTLIEMMPKVLANEIDTYLDVRYPLFLLGCGLSPSRRKLILVTVAVLL